MLGGVRDDLVQICQYVKAVHAYLRQHVTKHNNTAIAWNDFRLSTCLTVPSSVFDKTPMTDIPAAIDLLSEYQLLLQEVHCQVEVLAWGLDYSL